MRRAVIVAVVLATVLTGLIAYRIRAQRQTGPAGGSGVIEGEGSDLSARMSARVVARVEEGRPVGTGDVIVVLECAEPEARLAEAEARLAGARASADAAAANVDAARRSATAARASIGAARAQAAALDAQRDVAAREAARLGEMGDFATTSARDQAGASADGLGHRAEAARAQARASRQQASASTAQAQAAARQSDAAAQTARALEALVATARIGVAECEVRAPRPGVVERVYHEVGELIGTGSVVARVVEPGHVRTTFYLANADVGEASLGQAAEVIADAYPGRPFAATVHRIGLEAEFTPRNIQTRSDRDRLVYPIEVRVENADGLLRPGMPVEVTLGRSER